jgi:predicted transposase YdaD
VLFLKPIESEAVQLEQFEAENTLHRYRVIRLWEQQPTPLLNDPVLLPLAVLTQTEAPEALLEQVADRIDSIEDISQQRNLSAYAQLLAGLRFEKDLIRQIFRDSFMRESAIYQEIFQEGRQEGRQEGEQIIVLRLLSRRFGTLSADLQTRIRFLSPPQLETLSEALLEFNTVSDLINWLETS